MKISRYEIPMTTRTVGIFTNADGDLVLDTAYGGDDGDQVVMTRDEARELVEDLIDAFGLPFVKDEGYA